MSFQCQKTHYIWIGLDEAVASGINHRENGFLEIRPVHPPPSRICSRTSGVGLYILTSSRCKGIFSLKRFGGIHLSNMFSRKKCTHDLKIILKYFTIIILPPISLHFHLHIRFPPPSLRLTPIACRRHVNVQGAYWGPQLNGLFFQPRLIWITRICGSPSLFLERDHECFKRRIPVIQQRLKNNTTSAANCQPTATTEYVQFLRTTLKIIIDKIIYHVHRSRCF